MLFTACLDNKPPQADNAETLPGEEGIGNLNSKGVATTKGDDVYYKNPFSNQFYTFNLKTETTSPLADDALCVININDTIYYLSYALDEETQNFSCNMYMRPSEGEDILLFTDTEVSYPQISGGYLYYLKSVPDFNSGYSSYVYRAALSEGAVPELVCDVLCNSFYVYEDTLYYGDVSLTALMSVPVANAVSIAKESPLETGIQRSSSEIGANVLLNEAIAVNMVIKDNTLYFIDYLNQGEFCRYDFATGQISGFNSGIFINNYNIAGDYIYYHNQPDYCIYRMKIDGSEVQKVSSICDGQIILSNGYLIYVGISVNEATYGDRYISICDSEGNSIKDITFTEEYDAYRESEGSEEYYDDYAFEEELPETLPEESEITE